MRDKSMEPADSRSQKPSMRLSSVHIHIGDLDPILGWYVDTIGLQTTHRHRDKLAMIRGSGDCLIGLEAGSPVSEPERIHLIFEVANVDQTYEDLVRRGVVFVRRPENEPYGHRVAILRDPVGHTLELFTPIRQQTK